MFAIVSIKGRQYKITENQKLFVPKIEQEIGSKVTFSDVLALSTDGKSIEIGTPVLKMNVQATVLSHMKDDKVVVFKKKRRKGYKRTRGHRQDYTEIEINKIGDGQKAEVRSKKVEVSERAEVRSKKVEGEKKAEVGDKVEKSKSRKVKS
jgi:large subunit ribosomal protein L21